MRFPCRVSSRRNSPSASTCITLLVLFLVICLSVPESYVDAASRRTSSRRVSKTHGRSYSNRNKNAQTQSASHHAQQSAPKQAAPPGSVAANKASAPAPVNSAPKPAVNSAANAQSVPGNYGWKVNGQRPGGQGVAPPPYPGLGHNYAAPNGAPPPYNPYMQRQPGYGGYPQQPPPSYQQSYNPYMQHGYGAGAMPMGAAGGMGYGGGMYGGQPNNFGMMGGMGMGGMGMGMGGVGMSPGMMMMGYPQKKSSLFSMRNVLTGVALYGAYRTLTGGFGGYGGYGGGYHNYGPQEVHIYDHREHKPSDPNDLKPIMGTVGLPQSVTGEKIDLPAKTMEEIVKEVPVKNVTTTTVVNGTEVTTTVEDPLPPLPFDNMPKVYFGYGYAYGYQNATVDVLSAKDGRTIASNQPVVTMATTTVVIDTKKQEESITMSTAESELRASTTTVKAPTGDE